MTAHFLVNTASLLTVLLPKLPQFHGVHLFGVNKYRGMDLGITLEQRVVSSFPDFQEENTLEDGTLWAQPY